jgi:hypothetical protein
MYNSTSDTSSGHLDRDNYTIRQWLGILGGNASTSIIDTSLSGDITSTIEITSAPSDVSIIGGVGRGVELELPRASHPPLPVIEAVRAGPATEAAVASSSAETDRLCRADGGILRLARSSLPSRLTR